ncbi:hypothetical protein BDN72DRAFT_906872 [Pluteus cervinus]|uniref:Uncharacterized protein n=1 Tax=Pluteus cervinus TaxID=181527 RepID=A0ACD2ZXP4_9AGAR|nr:hypothetical protein BDN72DRAFT_906872 [Pluteus cervinus]
MSRLDQMTLLRFLVPYYDGATTKTKRNLLLRRAVTLWQDWFPEAPRDKRVLTRELHEDLEWASQVYPAGHAIDGTAWHQDLKLKNDRERRVNAWLDAAQKGIFETGPQYRNLITDAQRSFWKTCWEIKKAAIRRKEEQVRREQEFRVRKRRWEELVAGYEPSPALNYYTL